MMTRKSKEEQRAELPGLVEDVNDEMMDHAGLKTDTASHPETIPPLTNVEGGFLVDFIQQFKKANKNLRQSIMDSITSQNGQPLEVKDSTFLELPLEVRTMIYEYVLIASSIKDPPTYNIECPGQEAEYGEEGWMECCCIQNHCHLLPAQRSGLVRHNPFLLVCQQTKSETEMSFWKTVPLFIDGITVTDGPIPGQIDLDNEYDTALEYRIPQPVCESEKVIFGVMNRLEDIKAVRFVLCYFDLWAKSLEQNEFHDQEIVGIVLDRWVWSEWSVQKNLKTFYQTGRIIEQALDSLPFIRKWKVYTFQPSESEERLLDEMADQDMAHQIRKWMDMAYL